MSKRDTAADIPVLNVIHIRLLSLSYRISSTSPPPDIPTSANIEGRIRLRAYGIAKKSFKVTISHELRMNGVLCRMRHEARLASNDPINPELLKDDSLHHQIIKRLLPFHSELFAMLTSKSFTTPVVTSGELEIEKQTPD